MPPIGQVHIDQALTNVSVMYKNDMYCAEDVFPIVPVMKRSDKYFRYRREDFLSGSGLDATGKPLSLRRPGTEASEDDYQQDSAQYYCEEYAKRGIVTDAEYKIADTPLTPEIDQTEQLTEKLKIDNEMAVFGQAMNRSNFPTANKTALTTGGTGTSWASYTSVNSNPFTDIKNGKIAISKGIAKEANRIALTLPTARVLADHPLIKDLVKYVHADALTMSGLPKVIRGLSVIECQALRNTAAEGAAYSGNYIAAADDGTNAALIYYHNASPTLKSTAFGYTFEAPDDTTSARGYAVRKWREDKRKGNMVEVSFSRDWKFIGVDANNKSVGGYLITQTDA